MNMTDQQRAVLGEQWRTAMALWVPQYQWWRSLGASPDTAADCAADHYNDTGAATMLSAIPPATESTNV